MNTQVFKLRGRGTHKGLPFFWYARKKKIASDSDIKTHQRFSIGSIRLLQKKQIR